MWTINATRFVTNMETVPQILVGLPLVGLEGKFRTEQDQLQYEVEKGMTNERTIRGNDFDQQSEETKIPA
jgi:hypothetical protein